MICTDVIDKFEFLLVYQVFSHFFLVCVLLTFSRSPQQYFPPTLQVKVLNFSKHGVILL